MWWELTTRSCQAAAAHWVTGRQGYSSATLERKGVAWKDTETQTAYLQRQLVCETHLVKEVSVST